MSDSSEKTMLLTTLINLCDDLAWGRPACEDQLFALTREGAGPELLVRLAEAFGMMLVKVEGRKYHSAQLISDLTARNAELEEARQLLAQRNIQLMHTVQETYQAKKVIGQCDAMRRVIAFALSVARRPINTVILGPTGAGKEVIAKMIHFNSPRCEGPFVAVNCTAIPDTLFESEMFGIAKGVATGVLSHKGLVEEASGGTLFLDELGDMTLPNQAKLLRVIEEREVLRVGSSKPIPVDIKVIAATNVRLDDAVRAGTFREDLFYRINVAEICLPPLCTRGDDILLLAHIFLERHCTHMGRPRLTIAPAVQQCLLSYSWPGNVRELNNEMERAAALAPGELVEIADLSPRLRERAGAPASHCAASSDGEEQAETASAADAMPDIRGAHNYNLSDAERILINQALASTGGNRSRAAQLLGITREGLRKKLLRMHAHESGDPAALDTAAQE